MKNVNEICKKGIRFKITRKRLVSKLKYVWANINKSRVDQLIDFICKNNNVWCIKRSRVLITWLEKKKLKSMTGVYFGKANWEDLCQNKIFLSKRIEEFKITYILISSQSHSHNLSKYQD